MSHIHERMDFMLDLIVKGGTVVTASETFKADIGVEGEKISYIAAAGKLDYLVNKNADKGNITKVVDAQGRYVMPGLIEPHMHVMAPFNNTIDILDFYTASICAAFGGVTTFMDFSTTTKEVPVLQAVEERKAEMADSVLDYSVHAKFINAGDSREDLQGTVKKLVEDGIPTFKMFTIYPGVMINDADILKIMKAAKEEGALCGFHAESNAIADFMKQNLLDEGKQDWEFFNKAKPNACEAEAVNRILTFSELLDVPVYFYHLSTKEAVEMVRQAKKRGVKVLAETCGHYLMLTDEKNKGEDGINYLMSPPLRSEEDRIAMREGLKDGTLSLVTSDNEVFSRKIKEQNLKEDALTNGKIPDFSVPVNGIPGLEERFGLLMIGVNHGIISLNKLVEVSSTNPAKVFGCYPEKGTLEVGSDADIIVVDPERTVPLVRGNLHYPADLDYDLYEGFTSRGWPVCTIRRGEILIEDGRFKGKRKSGRFLKCSLKPRKEA